MSYENPIDPRIAQVVIDDLEDNNAHTLCDLLRAHYGLKGAPPWDSVAYIAYKAAQEVLDKWRWEKYHGGNDE